MNVKELREMLSTAPDEMMVMVMVENHLKPGMFAFAEACSCDTGIGSLGPEYIGGEDQGSVFLVLTHGFGVPEDEIEELKNPLEN